MTMYRTYYNNNYSSYMICFSPFIKFICTYVYIFVCGLNVFMGTY